MPSNIFLESLKEQKHSHLRLQYIHNGIIKKSVVQHICLLPYVCASWHPAHGQRKTFLSRAFGLCGRREQPFVPQADRRRAHNCPHKHNYTPRLRPVTQIQLHEPSQGPTIVPTHRGLARGQRVRRLSVDESVENEPGRSWSCATHTASVSVPRSRPENKSGPISSMWPAALPGSQPEKLLVRSLWSSQKVFGGTILTRNCF